MDVRYELEQLSAAIDEALREDDTEALAGLMRLVGRDMLDVVVKAGEMSRWISDTDDEKEATMEAVKSLCGKVHGIVRRP